MAIFMRLFIAREALDPHHKIGGPVLNTPLPTEVRLKAALNAAWRNALWYPRLCIPYLTAGNADVPKEHRAEVRRIRNASRPLARRLFHAMLRHGPKLDRRQVQLGHFVDEGAELLARAVVVGHSILGRKNPRRATQAELLQAAETCTTCG